MSEEVTNLIRRIIERDEEFVRNGEFLSDVVRIKWGAVEREMNAIVQSAVIQARAQRIKPTWQREYVFLSEQVYKFIELLQFWLTETHITPVTQYDIGLRKTTEKAIANFKKAYEVEMRGDKINKAQQDMRGENE